jgi:type I restriction enzyme S subunit
MSDLPNGWVRKTLGQVATWGSGGTPQSGNPKYYGGEIPWAIIGDLTDGEVWSTEKTITDAGLANSSAKLVPEGAILIAMYGSIGKLGVAKVPMATNQAIAFAVPNPDLMLDSYLFHFLLSQREIFLSKGKGATQQNISQTLLKSWEIPLPPIEEQKRIVEALDAQLSRMDNSYIELEQSAAKLELLKEAHRHRIVSGHYSSEINEWSSTTLGKIAKWSSGGTPQSGNPAYYGGDIPWCVIGDLTEGDVVDTTKQITQAGLAASSAKIVEPGTVMLAMYGASIGRTGLAAIPMATNQAIACAAPTSQVNPRYLLLLLQSQKRMFVNSGKGGAQPNISQSIIKDWAVSVPPIEEQNRLVTMSDNHQERMRLLEAQITEAQNLLTTLRRSMLNFAFTGQLTKEN